MHCASVKPGTDCMFMTKKGCSFNGGHCKPVVEACTGCERTLVFEGANYCTSFPDPESKWRRGPCNLATHAKVEKKETAQKVNPLKASKRKAAGR
jgi:hypothetical protein